MRWAAAPTGLHNSIFFNHNWSYLWLSVSGAGWNTPAAVWLGLSSLLNNELLVHISYRADQDSQKCVLKYWHYCQARGRTDHVPDLQKQDEAHISPGVSFKSVRVEELCSRVLCFPVRPAGGARVSSQLRWGCCCWPSHVAPCEVSAGAHSSGGRKESCSVLSWSGQHWLFCDDEWVRLSGSPTSPPTVLFMFSRLFPPVFLYLWGQTHVTADKTTALRVCSSVTGHVFVCMCKFMKELTLSKWCASHTAAPDG